MAVMGQDKCIYPGCKKPTKPGARYCYGHLAVVFFEKCCVHVTGKKWKGQPFKLMPWQYRVLMDVFGDVDKNGNRKKRFVWIEIPKKNGKSEFASGLALMGLCGPDNEGSPEVYCCAGDIKQARRVFDPCNFMVKNNPHLRGKLKTLDSQKRIINHSNNGILEVLSSEVYTKHGLNPSVVVFDEIHAQPNDQLWRVMTEETDVARDQQLVVVLTTAGEADKEQIGYKLHNHVMEIKNGNRPALDWYVVVYGADESEDFSDPKVWKRTNPALGYIFDMAKLKKNFEGVKSRPDKVVDWLRFRLNVWVGQVDRYIQIADWDACRKDYDIGDLMGRPCFGGLDLSTKVDLTSFVLLFPPLGDDDRFLIWPHFYIPADNMIQRQRKDNIPFTTWKKQGFLTATPGPGVDYEFIKRDIINASKLFNLQTVTFDPWAAYDVANQLTDQHGIQMVEFRQGYKTMSEPTKELQRMVVVGDIAHNGNPVMDWCINNLAVDIDATAENVKPTKKKSKERIDGAVALIDALGAYLLGKGNISRFDGDPSARVIVL